MSEKCYACDRMLLTSIWEKKPVFTEDGQKQFVGHNCYEKIKASGQNGFQPPIGGPRLFCSDPNPTRTLEKK